MKHSVAKAVSVFTVFFIMSVCSVAHAQSDKQDILTANISGDNKPNPGYIVKPAGDSDSGHVSLDYGEITLNWTAPGDDGNYGQAAGYDVRYILYSSGPINTEQRWQNAIQADGEPTPAPAGQAETMIVAGLELYTSYYFAVKSFDEAGNFSDLSNSPVFTVVDSSSSYYYIDTEENGCGSISYSPYKESYDYGDTVVFSAEPCESWEFVEWGGDIEGDDNPVTVVITSSLNVAAAFTTDFIPGDANGDGVVILSDITYLIAYFCGSNPSPIPFLAGDANGDCDVISSDVIYLHNYFRGCGDSPIRGDCE
ncbi:MAG: hypothetical protein J7K40_07485 [candidate division Zixibacteria bacterium]|nr:hypothetical protein [candidate division Zixibacteria bacterium]